MWASGQVHRTSKQDPHPFPDNPFQKPHSSMFLFLLKFRAQKWEAFPRSGSTSTDEGSTPCVSPLPTSLVQFWSPEAATTLVPTAQPISSRPLAYHCFSPTSRPVSLASCLC